MDDVLIQTLSGSFSPVQSIREQAETMLKQADSAPGYLQSLIRIWVNGSVCE